MPKDFPPQHQDQQPGFEYAMNPHPIDEDPNYKAAGKLKGKVAVITGGDSGIGRAITIAFAKEGANIAIVYLNEEFDAEETKKRVREIGQHCHLVPGDIRDELFCQEAVSQIIEEFGQIDILVNNAGEQCPQDSIIDISELQLVKTFESNVFSMFFMTKAVLKYMKEGGTIINTASITAYRGSSSLIDYSATKGAIVAFTRSLSQNLMDKNIRVNAVAPGPVWTPLIVSSFDMRNIPKFGQDTPMGRPGQPFELAPAFVYLASNEDSGYVSGQTIHVNGGEVVNG